MDGQRPSAQTQIAILGLKIVGGAVLVGSLFACYLSVASGESPHPRVPGFLCQATFMPVYMAALYCPVATSIVLVVAFVPVAVAATLEKPSIATIGYLLLAWWWLKLVWFVVH